MMVVRKRCVIVVVVLLAACAMCEDEDEKIPVSEHEFPKENIATRPDYRGEGHWATPAPDSGIQLGFVPIKLYTQVRRSISVKHLPRSDALASANTPEEIANAPRLKEVVSTKKISEVYSEEGYEDSAYDHGGFAKEAENHEGYDHHEGGKHKRMPKRRKSHVDDSESQGSDSQVKEVGISGEPLKKPIFKRHKVMRNATLLTVIENQGDYVVPSKLMASYIHTLQHPVPAPVSADKIEEDGSQLVAKDWTPMQKDEMIPSKLMTSYTHIVQHPVPAPVPADKIEEEKSKIVAKDWTPMQGEEVIYSKSMPSYIHTLQHPVSPVVPAQKIEEDRSKIVAKDWTPMQGDEVIPSKLMTSYTHIVQHPVPAPVPADQIEEEKSKIVAKDWTPMQGDEVIHSKSIPSYTHTLQHPVSPVVQAEKIEEDTSQLVAKDWTPTQGDQMIPSKLMTSYTHTVQHPVSPVVPAEKIEEDRSQLVPKDWTPTQGDEMIPSKLMTSYTHTVQHPVSPPVPADKVEEDRPQLIAKDWTPMKPPLHTTTMTVKETLSITPTYVPLLPYSQTSMPVLFMPTGVRQIPINTMDSYDLLKHHLYRMPFNNVRQLTVDSSFHVNTHKTTENPLNIQKKRILESTDPPEKEHLLDESSLTTESPMPIQNQEIISTIPPPLLTVLGYQRQHPSISIEDIQRSTTPTIGTVTSADDVSADDVQRRRIGHGEPGPGLQIEDSNQESIHQNPQIKVFSPINNIKLNDLNHKHKYKDISNFRNIENALKRYDIQQDTNITKHDEQQDILQISNGNSRSPGVSQEFMPNNSQPIKLNPQPIKSNPQPTKSNPQPIKLNSQPIKLDNHASVLPLWAKFIEALTLEQHSKENKKDKNPQNNYQMKEEMSETTDDSETLSSNHKVMKNTVESRYEHLPPTGEENKPDTSITSATESRQPDLSKIVKVINDAALEHIQIDPKHLVIGIVTLNPQSYNDASQLTSGANSTDDHEQDHQASAATSNTQRVPLASRRMDENTYGNPQYLSADDEDKRLELEEVLLEKEKDKELHKNVKEWKQALEHAEKGIVITPQVDTIKYPFYNSLPSNVLSLHSPLRYATNPKDVPRKTEGGMEFYDSRENVYCPEVTSPKNIIPKRKSPGEWNKRPKPHLPRLRGLGDKIDCMRAKYFGIDPLDNPFFKEETVNIPRKADPITDGDSFGFYADIMEHIRNLGDINRFPFHAETRPNRQKTSETNKHQIVKPAEIHDGNKYDKPQKVRDIYKYPNVATESEYIPHSGQTKNYVPTSIVPKLHHKYRNITHDNIKQTPGLLSVHPTYREEIMTGRPESGENYLTPSLSPTMDYRSPHSEVILGMAPPPPPTPSYLIIKTVTRSPSTLPTSILKLLSDSSSPNRIINTIAPSYNYKSVPQVKQYYANSADLHNGIVRQNAIAAATGQDIHGIRAFNGRNKVDYNRVRAGDNSDVMVAEESAEPDRILDASSDQMSRPHEINPHNRSRRSASRRHYENIDNNERQQPKRSQRKISNERKRPKTNKIIKEPAGERNRLNNARRRIDNEEEIEYQVYEANNKPNVRKNQKATRRNGIRERYNDGDYAVTVDYGITHDTDNSNDQLQSQPVVKPNKSSKKNKSKPREPGSDSRRGEPRYSEDQEIRKVNRKQSRNRGSTTDDETIRNGNLNSDSARRAKTKAPKKVIKINRKITPNLRQSCISDSSCSKVDTEIVTKSSSENSSEKQESEILVEDEGIKPKYSAKKSSKGFEVAEKESNSTSDDTSKNDELLAKLKSKYPDGLMSAAQINKVLGGFMSRHNPSYSSKYSSEDAVDTDVTTIDSNITETEAQKERNSNLDTKVKNTQKARVVPILNSKVLPELITSTQRPQEIVKERKIQSSKSRNTSTESSKLNRRQKTENKKTNSRSRNDSPEKEETVEQIKVSLDNRGYSSTGDAFKARDSGNTHRRQKVGIRDKGNAEQKNESTTGEDIYKINKRIPIGIKGIAENKKLENPVQKQSRNDWRVNRKNRRSNETQNSNSSKQKQQSGNEETETNNSTKPISKRFQSIEHRRVTKEEIYTSTYFPEDELIAEMEKQSELDAAELEDAGETGEKVIRNINKEADDEEEDDEDFYEPFESYNYETKHFRHPGNRLNHQNTGNDDTDQKRGYYIVHEPDHSPQEFSRPPKSHKDNSNFPVRKTYDHKETSEVQRNSDKGEFRTETPLKVTTKDGVKGFYIQKTLNSTPEKKEKITNTKQVISEELTYYVDPSTGVGEWVASTDESKFIGETKRKTDSSDYREESMRGNVRKQPKNSQSENRKVNKTSSIVESKSSRSKDESTNEDTINDRRKVIGDNRGRTNRLSRKGNLRSEKNNASSKNIEENDRKYDLDRNGQRLKKTSTDDKIYNPQHKKERTSRRRQEKTLDQDEQESASSEEYRNVEDFPISDDEDYEEIADESTLQTNTKVGNISSDEKKKMLHEVPKTNLKDKNSYPNYSRIDRNSKAYRQPNKSSEKGEQNSSEEDTEIIENYEEEPITTEHIVSSNERKLSNNSNSNDKPSLTDEGDTEPQYIKHPGERKYYYVDETGSKRSQFRQDKRRSKPERRNQRYRSREETEEEE